MEYKSQNSQKIKSEMTTFWETMLLPTSVADPGCLSRIPDPDFYPSRIPNPGSRIPDLKTGTKESGEKKIALPFFVATNFTKL
jgi:hypothetical protein